jgi:hypothetical protein
MIEQVKALPKPCQVVIIVTCTILGGAMVSEALANIFHYDTMNPFVLFLIGLGILIVTGNYVMR